MFSLGSSWSDTDLCAWEQPETSLLSCCSPLFNTGSLLTWNFQVSQAGWTNELQVFAHLCLLSHRDYKHVPPLSSVCLFGWLVGWLVLFWHVFWRSKSVPTLARQAFSSLASFSLACLTCLVRREWSSSIYHHPESVHPPASCFSVLCSPESLVLPFKRSYVRSTFSNALHFHPPPVRPPLSVFDLRAVMSHSPKKWSKCVVRIE